MVRAFLARRWPTAMLLAVLLLGIVLPLLLVAPRFLDMLRVPPIEIVGKASAFLTPEGAFRVQRTVRINEQCDWQVWDRTFLVNGTLRPTRLRALRSSVGGGAALDPISSSPGEPIGTNTRWWDYPIIPGARGTLLVTVIPRGCPSGWDHPIPIYSVDFDWSAIAGPGEVPFRPPPPLE